MHSTKEDCSREFGRRVFAKLWVLLIKQIFIMYYFRKIKKVFTGITTAVKEGRDTNILDYRSLNVWKKHQALSVY